MSKLLRKFRGPVLLALLLAVVTVNGAVCAAAEVQPLLETDVMGGISPDTSPTDPVFGLRLALLPLADVSQSSNGINLKMTHALANALRNRGVDLVPEGDILQFMTDNRIRFAGYLDSLLARKLGRTFDCRMILLGTVTEFEREQEPSIGLTLTVMDASTGSPVWATTHALSVNEQVRLLGLGEPQTVEDLEQPLLNELVDDLHENLPKSLPDQDKLYQIISARATPAYVRSGEVVDFRLEIRFVNNPPQQILLDTKAGIVPLYQGKVKSIYLGHWMAPLASGVYRVTLMFDWGRGGPAQRLPDIASYQVINESPALEVVMKNGLQIGDVTAFRSGLIILPTLQGTTPISHWELTIKAERGNVVLKEERDGVLPSKLVWQGTDAKRRRLQDGSYELSLDVWDAAGNHSGSIHKVALKRSTVPVKIASVVREGKTYLKIDRVDTSVVPVSKWSIKVSSLAGKSLLETKGDFLPALLELPPLGVDATLLCDIEVEDDLGNYLSLTETKVRVEKPEVAVVQKAAVATESWVEDF